MRVLSFLLMGLSLAACTPETPAPTPAPSRAPVAAPQLQAGDFEARVFAGINVERRARGLPVLAPMAALDAAAAAHLRDLAATGAFTHTGSDGSTPSKRVARQGVKSCLTAENLFKGPMPPEAVVAAWMQSQGHRENNLRRGPTHLGVARQGQLVAAVFAKPC